MYITMFVFVTALMTFLYGLGIVLLGLKRKASTELIQKGITFTIGGGLVMLAIYFAL